MIAVIEQLLLAGSMVEAEDMCEQLLAAGNYACSGVFRLGVIARQQGNVALAKKLLKSLLGRMNPHAELFHELGTVCQEQGCLAEAAGYYVRSIAQAPEKAESYFNLGVMRMALDEYESAIGCFRKAAELLPNSLESRHNLAVCLQESGLLAEAEAEYTRISQEFPEFDEARFNRAFFDLLRGDFRVGWPGYEYRFTRKEPVPERSFIQPRWDGRHLAGATILLHAEQGFGDTIQAVRYVPLVAYSGGRVVLEVPPVLKRLMAGLPGADVVISRGDTLPSFDCHLPLMSLPLVFGTTIDSVPVALRYLYPDQLLVKKWQELLPRDGVLNVGLVWSGRQDHVINRKRSCSPAAMAPLAHVAGVRYYSLQVDDDPTNGDAGVVLPLSSLPGILADFADTAACIENLDLIISIDTAVAHLAGALGKPVWLILPFVADWRWLLDREDSPWYPTMHLFRQEQRGAWHSVLERIAAELVRLVAGQCSIVASHHAVNPISVPVIANSALRKHEEGPDALLARGVAFYEAERYEEALAVYDCLLGMDQGLGVAHHNRANTLLAMGHYREAIVGYSRAIALIPNFSEGHVTIATALQAMHRPYEAMASCHRALAIDPECAEAHWNLALALLQVGEFAAGWQEFEWRWRKRGFTSRERIFSQPLWDGSPLSGKTILIHAEQGFGDAFQFARYLPLLAGQGGTVIVECPVPLQRLMAGISGVADVVTSGEPLPFFDCHLPIMSLPLRFDTTIDSIPTTIPYILPPLESVAKWVGKFSELTSLRVGLVWAGRKKPDPNRTCPLRFLRPLADVAGVRFFSLQVDNELSGCADDRWEFPLVDYTADLKDFGDTAALIANLDLVVSIDTGVAHLAGAMGKDTWLLLPHAADWRWMLDRGDSPWYPSMRLFRQQVPGDWAGVVDHVVMALRDRVCHAALLNQQSRVPFASLYSAGLGFMEQDDTVAAERCFLAALLHGSRMPEIFNGLGVTCGKRAGLQEALSLFRHAVAIDPEFVDGFINLGNGLFALDRFDEAVLAFQRALGTAPDDARVYQNLGVVLQAMGRFSDAEAAFVAALRCSPGYGTARWNLAVLKLLVGDWQEGFQEFEARFVKKESVPVLHSNLPRWDGKPFAGQTLLVHAEQGFGDTLQFCRYLSLVTRMGGKVVFECQDRSLQELLHNSFPDVQVVVRGDRVPTSDLQVPLLSLPGLFATRIATVPVNVPYVRPSREKVEHWQRQLRNHTGLRAGLVWAGRLKPDPKRSMNLSDLAPLGRIPDIAFYSLQIGRGSDQAQSPPDSMILHDYTARFHDFSDTAAFIANLDLVITIDSAVAHLAGALGKKTWVLLPFAADWRWLHNRDDSPWYPTMWLFRQATPGDWQGVAHEVRDALANIAAG